MNTATIPGPDTAAKRAYWGTPDVSPERESAWRRWVDDYALGCSLRWLSDPEVTDEAALAGAQIIVADLAQIDDLDWMPLGPALAERQTPTDSTSPPEGDARLDHMRAVRTVATATEHEHTQAVAYQLGIAVSEAQKMIAALRRDTGREADGEGRTALYRYYDNSGVLLYVGITKDAGARDEQHARTSPWHRLQAKRSVRWYDTREDAADAERRAIQAERPLFNATHSTPDTKHRAMEYLIGRAIASTEQVAS